MIGFKILARYLPQFRCSRSVGSDSMVKARHPVNDILALDQSCPFELSLLGQLTSINELFALDKIAPLTIKDRFALGQSLVDPSSRWSILPMDLINNTAPVGLDSVFCGGQFAKGLE